MRRLMWFTLGFAGACLLSVYLLPERWLPWAALTACGLLVLIVGASRLTQRRFLRSGVPAAASSRRTEAVYRAVVRFLVIGLAAGLLWCWAYTAWRLAPAHALEGDYDELSAELSDYPVETWYGHRADAYVELSGQRVMVRFYLYGSLPELEPGDRISGSFRLRRADRNSDGEQWLDLQARGIPLTASGQAADCTAGGRPWRYFPARWSKAVFDRLGELLPADAAGLPQAMLTGKRSGLPEAVSSDLSAAGASHIVAVSGLHVAMLTGLLLLLLGRGRFSALLCLPVLALYVLMTGASPSVIRAALMLGLLLLAPIFGEENDPPSSLSLAGLVLLLQNPWVIANLSFQLSFAAVAGLLLISEPLLDCFLALPRTERLLKWNGPKVWPSWLRTLVLRTLRVLVRGFFAGVSASIGAQIFSTPIAALAFGSLPVYGILTNLFVLPLASLCLVGTLAVLALGLVGTALGSWMGWLLAWPVRAIMWICRAVARLPGRLLYLDAYGLLFLAFVALALLLTLLLRERRFGRPLLSALLVLLGAALLQGLETRAPSFTLGVLDVGQGQCVCLVTEEYAVMTDCGGSGGPAVGVTAAEWLRRKGAERLDALILTHYDDDHVSGVETLLSLVPVTTVYLPEFSFDPENRSAVERAARAAGAELRRVTEDLTLSCEGGQVRLFAPVSDKNDNAACVSVLYSVEEYDMLVTGDLDAGGEYALLERERLTPVEAYVAGHHGSSGSTSAALLEALRPDTVFISVGRNSYGLPSGETLARLEAVGAQIYRTDECGNLEITVP